MGSRPLYSFTPSAEVMNETMRTAYNTVALPRPPNGSGRRIGVVPINDHRPEL